MNPTTSLRVLMVDEEAATRTAFAEAMRRRGLVVDTVAAESEAIAMASRQRYSVVVASQTGGVGGVAIADQILAAQPATVFILLAELHHLDLPRDLGTDRAVVALLAKPWDDDELEGAIRRAAQLSAWRASGGDRLPTTTERASLLLIDESPTHVQLVQALLEQTVADRFRIDHVARIDSAIASLRSTNYLVVLASLSVADANGHDAITRLHRAAPATAIVALSDREDEESALEAIQFGAQDYLIRGRIDGTSLYRSLRFAIERKRAEQRLAQLAHFDQLTGLANRGTFHDHLQQCFHRAQRGCRRFAVMYVDLDRFKGVNDTFGHDAGDVLLREVGSRLQRVVRRYDTVGRLGGDEFALLLEELIDSADVNVTAERIVHCLREPVLLNGEEVQVSASIGVAVFPDAGETPQDLLAAADRAMYDVKSAGRDGFRIAQTVSQGGGPPRLLLSRALKGARSRDELQVHYQPWIDLRTCLPIGFEALLRWKPSKGTFVPTEEFLPILEDTALIVDVGHWVMDTACRQLREWHLAGLARRISINLSPRELQRPDLARTLRATLAAHDIPPQWVDVEIEEAQLMSQMATSRTSLIDLKALGVRLVVDNFGGGSSSVASLRRFAVDAMKIDRALIAPIGRSRDAELIVGASLKIGQELGLDMIAKGVERHDQLDWLVAKGCRLAQGYLFARPTPAGSVGPNDDEDEDADAAKPTTGSPSALVPVPSDRQNRSHVCLP